MPDKARIKINILGSTGSVGRNTVDVVRAHPNRFDVMAITGRGNIELLAEQAKLLRVKMAVTADANRLHDLQKLLSGTGIAVAAGESAMIEAASMPVDVTVAAIVGFDGLRPTMAALRHSRRLAFVSKECLVCAGDLFLSEARAYGCEIIPTDSEHSAIFQILHGRTDGAKVQSITLTASGGPFLNFSDADMRRITPAMAASHPVWNMGQKISIDSATMMNKALEIVEAYYLFQKPEHQIDVVIHPEGIVHSLVSYVDGAVMAHMGKPDMRLPIAYALFYPDRQPMANSALNLTQIGNLRFMAPDHGRFPSLNLARECLRLGGGMPLALNAANEIAVARFIAGDIGFMAIFTLLQDVLDYAGKKYAGDSAKILPDIAAMMAVDSDIRAAAAKWAPRPSVHLAVAG